MEARAAKAARDLALWGAAAAALAVGLAVFAGSLSWIGRSFPGFLILDNRVVASAGLAHWPDARAALFQSEIVSINGEPLRNGAAINAYVASRPSGTAFQYELRQRGNVRTSTIRSRAFERDDWALLFGTYLFCGAGLCGIALCIRYLRGSDPAAAGTATALYVIGIWALTAVDLYGPARWFRIHALAETFLGPVTLHLSASFPAPLSQRSRWSRYGIRAAYAFGAALALVNQLGLYDADRYRASHRIAQSAFGVALLAFVGGLAWGWLRPRDFESRQRLKVVSLGSLLALTPQVVLLLLAYVKGSDAPQNALAWSGMLFPASLAYAVLRQNLLGVDELVRRVLNYAILSVSAAAIYGAALIGAQALFAKTGIAGEGILSLALVPLSMLLLLPLRDRMQAAIDKTFFRSAWDFRKIVETTSAHLASVTSLSVVADELRRAVGETLQPSWSALHVRLASGWTRVDSSEGAAAIDASAVADAEALRVPTDGAAGTLFVPFRTQRGLVALLLLGRPLSGKGYGGYDRSLLLTLANQGALAIENARALEELRDLNRTLEGKVQERTRHLAAALSELRETQAQLVHREKMASIGQFVAGIAHEMNNPLSFIEGNLHFLRAYASTLASAIARYESALSDPSAADAIRRELDLDHVLADLSSVLEGCGEGVTRTSGLVRDLRTFSRVDASEFVLVDLAEAIDSTLNLLRAQLKGRTVDRDFHPLPRVECLGGQINQVLLNLISNAADAVASDGRIVIRTRSAGNDRVAIEVEDNGCGIAPEHLERIFDPFFTTKEPGKGTGLGLAISYGVVSRHAGSLTVRSEPGAGSCFRVELPVRWSGGTPADDAL